MAHVPAGQRERWAVELARREEVLRSLDGLLRRPDRVRYDVAIGPRAPVRLRIPPAELVTRLAVTLSP